MQRIGKHTVRVGEHQDTIVLTLRGDVTLDDAKQIFDFMAARFAGQSYMLVTGDMSELGHVLAEARKMLVTASSRIPPIRGLVYHRASFTARVLTELVVRGYALATGADFPVHFVKDEAEAGAWLARRRAQLIRGGTA
ncbi:hypothetical protein WMF37_29425 [Sorangium sp. So ce291]|uniref:hypothetical protein n=1 Tax=Sorangium sp. So ce291 TaxID=3133294 RepID=UPI003F6475A7